MKPNKFQNLAAEDRELVLKTCDQNPYHIAVQILAKPRAEGGLDLITSRTALCRFYTHHHPGQAAIELLGQYADAIRIKGQAHSASLLEAIFILAQNRLLKSLRSTKPFAELEREFRILERLQRCFHADLKRRKEQGSAATRAYDNHLALLNATPEIDYIRTDLPADPGAGELTAADLKTSTTLESDLLIARAKQATRQARAAEDAEIFDLIDQFQAARSASVPPQTNEKHPEIPHIPQNSVIENVPSFLLPVLKPCFESASSPVGKSDGCR